MNVPKLI